MPEAEYINFGQKLAFHTAPTLLGIKCANLISLSCDEYDIDAHCEYFNRKVCSKGLEMKVLCRCEKLARILIYNKKMLSERIKDKNVRIMLEKCGYDKNASTDECLEYLGSRISCCDSFPHEIGIFLGYPLEDVEGFIRNKGENFKLCGCWKVYGNAESAQRTFTSYDRCRKFLCRKLNEGADIYQALRIS